MKILIVNISDIQGGAARAAYRLHDTLLQLNKNSQMLVQNKYSSDSRVHTLNTTKNQTFLNKLRPYINTLPVKFYKKRTKTLFSPSWFGLSNFIDTLSTLKPDIVHLHWISGGMIKIEDLAQIKVPIVWSLHDMWAFTGGCHYDEECHAYLNECGNCKVLGSHTEKDLSRKIFKRKQKTFSSIPNMTIIGLSKWLSTCASNSTLLKNKNHINLPNPIDTNIFKPIDKIDAKKYWNFPKDKKIILFGAMGATSDSRKGFQILCKALHKLTDTDIEFVIFGNPNIYQTQDFRFKTYYLGNVVDNASLVSLYNGADILIVPSLQENLSNIIMEGLACAIPVVGFDIGGNEDMIVHKHTGYLAKAFDTDDMAYGISWILNNANYAKLSSNAREKILKEFDSIVVTKKYIALYEKILNES